jgi:aspartate carbamoyltransferase catalytic subunit
MTPTKAIPEPARVAPPDPPTRDCSRSLLSVTSLGVDDVSAILRLATQLESEEPTLRARRLAHRRSALLFYESSTRTRTSFELAAKGLGADTALISSQSSSIEKGESLKDTGITLRALGAECIILRHANSGAPYLLAKATGLPVLNAGDGMHEHPSQALLDTYTILRHKKTLRGLRVTIVGDIYHSRVARSAIHLLSKFGAQITLCGPAGLLPELASTLAPGLNLTRTVEEAVAGADVVMVLRVQKERLAGTKISLEDYVAEYQMTMPRLRLAKRDALLMHPGPIIRGLELTWEVADCPQSVIVEEVSNGVPVRMAILAKAAGRAA